MAYQPPPSHEEGVAGPSGAVYYAQPPSASPYGAPPYGYASSMHGAYHVQQQSHPQQQQYVQPQYMVGQQQVYYAQQAGYAYGGYAPAYSAPPPLPPQQHQQQHPPQPLTHHTARLPPKPHVLPPSSPSVATPSPSVAHLSLQPLRASPRSALIPLPSAASKLAGPAARLPPLPPKPLLPARNAEDELELLRAALEAAQKREEAWGLRLEALGMQPSLALQAHQADLTGGQEAPSKDNKEDEQKPAPVLGVRLLQRVHALQVENEELGEMLSRKLGLDNEEQNEVKQQGKTDDLEDAMRLVRALDAALTRATTRAEQAERALAVACAQNSRSLLEDEALKLNNVHVHADASASSGKSAAAATPGAITSSTDATPTASAEASTTGSSSKSSPRTSLSAMSLSSSGAFVPLTNGEKCPPVASSTALPTSSAAGRGRGRGGSHRGAQRGGAGGGGRASLPPRGAWNTGRAA